MKVAASPAETKTTADGVSVSASPSQWQLQHLSSQHSTQIGHP